MVKLLRILVVLAALATATAATALAAKPDKNPSPGNPGVTFPAGLVCPFELTASDVVNNSTTTTHYDQQGGVRWEHGSGRIVSRFAGNGKSVDLNLSGPGKITFGDDGLLHVDGTGPWALLFFPGDSPSSTVLYLRGHFHFTVDLGTGKLTLVSHTGRVDNICDMLS
jgi:hypothetical protein